MQIIKDVIFIIFLWEKYYISKDNSIIERLPANKRKLQIQETSVEVFISKGFAQTTKTDI